MTAPDHRGPFSVALFRPLWAIALTANICALTQTVAAGWTVAAAGSASQVASVQTALTLPVMLLAVIAGTLADHIGPPRIIATAFALMFLSSAGLSLLAMGQLVSPNILLGACFLFGCGTALLNPTLTSTVGDYLPSAILPEGLAAIGIANNLARCVGPALGGLLVAAMGTTITYSFNAIAALTMMIAAARTLQHGRQQSGGHFGDAILDGFRLASRSPELRIVLGRSFAYSSASSAIWALMPLLARDQLHGDAKAYGVLMSGLGLGAILFALRVRAIRLRLGMEGTVRWFTAAGAFALLILPHLYTLSIALPALLLLGASYTGVMTVWSATAQLSAPRHLAGRAVGSFHTALFGGMALGSWFWGHLAQSFGLPLVLSLSGLAVALTLITGWRWPVPIPSVD
jgi:MFS family permease